MVEEPQAVSDGPGSISFGSTSSSSGWTGAAAFVSSPLDPFLASGCAEADFRASSNSSSRIFLGEPEKTRVHRRIINLFSEERSSPADRRCWTWKAHNES